MDLKFINNDNHTSIEFSGTVDDLVASVEILLVGTLDYNSYKIVSQLVGTKGILSQDDYNELKSELTEK